MTEPPITDTSRSARLSLGILLVHVALVTGFGEYYAKLQLSFGGFDLYLTEVALIAAMAFGLKATLALLRDLITKLVLVSSRSTARGSR